MSFFSQLFDTVKKKKAELDDRKEFLDMVEKKARPIRRAAYMNQMLKEVVNEGIEKAKLDAKAKIPKKEKTESDFGIKKLEDPYKFLDELATKRRNKK